MKIESLKCAGKTDEDGNHEKDGEHITFVVDMDDGSEYSLIMSREEACNFHFALGKYLIETDFKFKENY